MGDNESFYAAVPVFRGFRSLMDPALYQPLPDNWTIGTADIVQSTRAIAEKRYKAVNMAGAAVIASVTNTLGGREFPFVFGGDGASFAVAPHDLSAARDALAATAAWVNGELRPHHARRAHPDRGHPRATARRARGAFRAVAERLLRHVLRRRARLGRRCDETRRIRRHAGAARHLARSHRAVVPVRGNPDRATGSFFRC